MKMKLKQIVMILFPAQAIKNRFDIYIQLAILSIHTTEP